ncbi:hypothetical protein M409DRAFT_52703 [Zasmidium cellare ATCC 36951]|uniref:ASST-domain-containing protein n=1 Tax=Zasmidium cellare ATCC 36951 TaxID=1080233 RepID=A0A6A6CQA0_ZASCE|nr:uncharacterized protein M409DRAFT_52703 [Zasmidium cellare ATCC 36951]KAF2169467.1 hypothetical protein M409DRAFT_52703 [Zasmidium cellare ATCC 36951]
MTRSGRRFISLFGILGIVLSRCDLLSANAESKSCVPAQYGVVETATLGVSVCAATHFSTVASSDGPTRSYRQYVSSQAQPPVIRVNRTRQSLSSGLLFITPEMFSHVLQRPVPAALIVTMDGDLVWSANFASPGAMIINLHPQQLYGKPVITYCNGTKGHVKGYGAGAVEILDDRYEKVASICPRLNVNVDTPMSSTTDCFCDYHEALITGDNTILVTVYNKTRADLTSVGGPKDGYVIDSLAVEVDIETNESLFVWRAMDHVPLNHSHRQVEQSGTESDPYDWFHINSIQPWDNGFLINSRHTWTTYLVSREGEVIWRINGADGGDFGDLPDLGHFHDARLHSHGNGQLELTYFANNKQTNDGPGSVALALALTVPPNRLNPPSLRECLFESKRPIVARAGGSHQVLPNGNRLVGYGDQPLMKEFGRAPDDKTWEVRWTAQLPYTRHSYRAFKQDWHARPTTRPEMTIQRVNNETHNQLDHCAGDSRWRGYISWNGATDVAQYTIYYDIGDGNMRKYVTVPKMGFETEFVVPLGAARVQVAARECPGGNESLVFFNLQEKTPLTLTIVISVSASKCCLFNLLPRMVEECLSTRRRTTRAGAFVPGGCTLCRLTFRVACDCSLLLSIDVMSDPQSSAWLLQGVSGEKAPSIDDEEQISSQWSLSHRQRRSSSAQRRYSWFRIAVLVGFVLNNLIWYAAWRGWLSTTTRVENSHLNYFLQQGEPEAIEVPFEHDWTGLEEIEVNGYR